MAQQMKRNFSNKEKVTLFLYADGKCQICGEELKNDWHADHVKPYSESGITDVINGQALCPKCNLKKGAKKSMQLRLWQKELTNKYFNVNQQDFLVMALPGSGKTIASLNIAKILMDNNNINGIIIVTPTEHLKNQWKDDAHRYFNLELLPNFKTQNGIWSKDFNGICTTYQQVAQCSLIFRHLCSKKELLIIFDEIHHCGDTLSWGDNVKEAFEYSKKRLALSGTPFRNDNNKIPFVRYINDVCHPDFSYEYPQAILDNIIRIIIFEYGDGDLGWLSYGEREEGRFTDEDIYIDGMRKRLSTALDLKGRWLWSLIRNANDKLNHIRQSHPKAGGLIIAQNIYHAKQISQSGIFDTKPTIVTSEDPRASEKINKYRKSDDKWIIAVDMISEGVDIKRLRVLVYVSNVTTELYFRQAIGRISRFMDENDKEAYCYLPQDKRLVEYVNNLETIQKHAIELKEKKDKEKKDQLIDEIAPERDFMPLYSSEVIPSIVAIEGRTYDKKFVEKIELIANKFGNSTAALLQALEEAQKMQLKEEIKDEAILENDSLPKADLLKDLRQKAKSLAYRLSKKQDVDPEKIHIRWMSMGGKPHNKNDLHDLENKISWLQSELRNYE